MKIGFRDQTWVTHHIWNAVLVLKKIGYFHGNLHLLHIIIAEFPTVPCSSRQFPAVPCSSRKFPAVPGSSWAVPALPNCTETDFKIRFEHFCKKEKNLVQLWTVLLKWVNAGNIYCDIIEISIKTKASIHLSWNHKKSLNHRFSKSLGLE